MMASLDVLLGDVPVGSLASQPDGRIAFRFARPYRELVFRPILSQRYEDDLERVYIGKRPGELPAFFAHLLPEGGLRGVLERSLNLASPSDFELIASVGSDLPGAVRLVPSEEVDATAFAAPRDDSDVPPDSGVGLHFSLAGVQLKFSVLRDADRFTLPARDRTGEWILKLPLANYGGLAENEFAVLDWARASGFVVPETRLVSAEELGELAKYAPSVINALAIRRYDRIDGRRLHQEDMAQVLGWQPQPDGTDKYASTYETVVTLVRAIVGIPAAFEAVKRLVFVIASGNNDAHLKNWSLLYQDGVTPSLAPLYDQVATVSWPNLDRRLALKLASAREFGRVTMDSFRRLARRAEIDERRVEIEVRDVLRRIMDAWLERAARLLAPEHADAIRAHWQRVPLLREAGMLF